MDIETSDLAVRDTYALMTSLIVPRPIAWITTRSAEGVTNLAPFSYFTGVGSDPMMIAVSIGAKRTEGGFVDKDTLRNIKDTEVFCVHLVEEAQAEAMNLSASNFPADVSEIEEAGLATLPCGSIPCVRLRDARAALECKLVDNHVHGRKGTFNLVVGEVLRVYLNDDILEGGAAKVDPHKISPVARLGGAHYARLGERFQITRGD